MTAGVWAGCGWMAGVGAALLLAPGRPLVGALALALALPAGAVALLLRPAWIVLCAALLLAGAARAEIPLYDGAALARAPALAGEVVTLTGVIDDDTKSSGATWEASVAPAAIHSMRGRLPPLGDLLLHARGADPPGQGDRVSASGRLRLPAERAGFDRRAYLATRGIALELDATRVTVLAAGRGLAVLPARIRGGYQAGTAAILPAPASSLLVGIVLGVRAGIPPRLRDDLIATGLVHLLVLSGLKVAVFARLASALLRPLPVGWSTWPLLGLIGLYALVGGATPAGLRAAAMGCLALLGARLGRPPLVWNSLALTGAAMLAWRPEWALDSGFLLSFLGTAAIVLLTPGIEARLHFLPRLFREPFAVTAAAQVGTLPVSAAGFGLLSPVAPLSNALVLPLLPLMVGAGLLLAPLGLLAPGIGRLAALPMAALLAYLEQVAHLLARIPGAVLPVVTFPTWLGFAYYAALGGGFLAWQSAGLRRLAALLLAVCLPLGIAGGELVSWLRQPPELAVLDVGNGDALLFSGPAGAVLLDGGPSPARLAAGLGERLPPWQRRLDAVVISATGAGQVAGLAGLDRSVGTVYLPRGPLPGSAWRLAVTAFGVQGTAVEEVGAGDRWRRAGLEWQALAPGPGADDPAGVSLALRVVGPSGKALCELGALDTDAQLEAAARLPGRCDYLLLSGSGSAPPPPEFLDRARPSVYLISAAAARPAPDIPAGSQRRTDQEGTIVLPL